MIRHELQVIKWILEALGPFYFFYFNIIYAPYYGVETLISFLSFLFYLSFIVIFVFIAQVNPCGFDLVQYYNTYILASKATMDFWFIKFDH